MCWCDDVLLVIWDVLQMCHNLCRRDRCLVGIVVLVKSVRLNFVDNMLYSVPLVGGECSGVNVILVLRGVSVRQSKSLLSGFVLCVDFGAPKCAVRGCCHSGSDAV